MGGKGCWGNRLLLGEFAAHLLEDLVLLLLQLEVFAEFCAFGVTQAHLLPVGT